MEALVSESINADKQLKTLYRDYCEIYEFNKANSLLMHKSLSNNEEYSLQEVQHLQELYDQQQFVNIENEHKLKNLVNRFQTTSQQQLIFRKCVDLLGPILDNASLDFSINEEAIDGLNLLKEKEPNLDSSQIYTQFQQSRLVFNGPEHDQMLDIAKQFNLVSTYTQKFTWDQLNIMYMIANARLFINEAPKLYLLNSPTGSGKTITYLLGLMLNTYQDPESTSLIFSNSNEVAWQTFQRSCSIIENVRQIYVQVSYSKDKSIQIQFIDNSGEPKMCFSTGKCTVNSPNCLSHVKVSRKSCYLAYQTQIKANSLTGFDKNGNKQFINLDYYRETLKFGNIIHCTLQCQQFLTDFGVIAWDSKVNTVVYDEVDVFYNTRRISEFHRFYYSQLYNLTADQVIFVSATLTKEYLDTEDSNIVPAQFFKTLKQLSHKQHATHMSQSTFITTQQSVHLTMFQIGDEQKLLNQLWQNSAAYIYFDIQKGFTGYMKITGKHIVIKHRNYVQKINFSQGAYVQQIKLLIQKYSKLYVTNVIARAQNFFSLQGLQSFRSPMQVSKFNSLVPMISIHQQDSLSLTEVKEQLALLTKQDKQTLYISLNDQYMYNFNSSLVSSFSQQQSQVNSSNLGEMPKINERMSFWFQLKQTMYLSDQKSNLDPINEKAHYHDDFSKIGRGIDIGSLKRVVICVPLHFNLIDINFTEQELKQICGRVGRFGKVGEVLILPLKVQQQDLSSDDMSNQMLLKYLNRGNVQFSSLQQEHTWQQLQIFQDNQLLILQNMIPQQYITNKQILQSLDAGI